MNSTGLDFLRDLKLTEPPLSTVAIAAFGILLFVVLHHLQPKNAPKPGVVKDSRYSKPKITPMPKFEWDSENFTHYPFKDKPYQLNMGIQKLDPNDWLVLDRTYKEKVRIKNQIIHNNHPDYPPEKDLRDCTFFYLPEAKEAVWELYEMVLDYNCQKYPQYFVKKSDKVINKILNVTVPAKVDRTEDPQVYIEHIANLAEEDFIILLKDPSRINQEDGSEYFFKAGIFAFAAGFNPRDRFDAPLSFIHHPIPGYEQKLKRSMNNFFDKILPHQFVTRANFSVQTHNKFYVDDMNKGHNLPADHVQKPLEYDELDFKNGVYYRSERQTLTKLPKTKAVVFTIRTYLTPMCQLREEPDEVRLRFAGAIRKFPDDIAGYKRSQEWGPAVVEYLERDHV